MPSSMKDLGVLNSVSSSVMQPTVCPDTHLGLPTSPLKFSNRSLVLNFIAEKAPMMWDLDSKVGILKQSEDGL